MAVTIRTKTDTATKTLELLKRAMTPQAQNSVVRSAAAKTLAEVIRETPVGYTSNTRKAWRMDQLAPARWVVRINPSNAKALQVLGFLEDGTKAHGPVKAKFLYVPQNAGASLGWKPGLKRGVDYILTKWVRGITGLHIVERARDKSRVWLKDAMVAYLRRVKENAGV